MTISNFLKGKIEPLVTITFRSLQALLVEHGFNAIYKAINEASEDMRKMVDYFYSATSFRVTNAYGDTFKASLIADELTLWSSTDEALVTIRDIKELNKAKAIIDAYTEGEIPCSKCDAIIKRSEIAGKMYAGVYCKECWEGGMKQKEARENYD